jgi:hypothetical protein
VVVVVFVVVFVVLVCFFQKPIRPSTRRSLPNPNVKVFSLQLHFCCCVKLNNQISTQANKVNNFNIDYNCWMIVDL